MIYIQKREKLQPHSVNARCPVCGRLGLWQRADSENWLVVHEIEPGLFVTDGCYVARVNAPKEVSAQCI